MAHELINEQVDIYQLPAIDAAHQGHAGVEITIGDLHGNAMKLIFMLAKHGIATHINTSDYTKLVKIYKTPTQNLTKTHLNEFNQLLSKIEFSHDTLIRLIGDELADRGNNDYFTLKILEKLKEHNVPVEILISNHSVEFIEAYEIQDDFHAPMLTIGNHAPSMENLQTLVAKGLVARDELLAIANHSYKPTLRAISYSLSEDKKEMTLYSHAGIGLKTIQCLAQKLNVEYNDTTANALAHTIDSINVQFQQHVQNNTVHTLYARETLLKAYTSRAADLRKTPLEFIMWNRLYVHINRPAVYAGYTIHYVHGHDSTKPTKPNIYNLDNDLGKIENMNQGAYTVLYLRKANRAPAMRLSELHLDFLSQLNEIKIKEHQLRNKGHIQAANYAKDLYQTTTNQHEELTSATINLQTFKNNCMHAIAIARPELEKHRGWKQILGNLALSIAGLGILYAIAGLIHKAVTGHFLFFKTDSAHKIDQLEQSVKAMNN